MSEKAFVYVTAHRDQLKSPAGRAEVRSWLRESFASLGAFRRFHKFHVDRFDEPPLMREFLTPELRALGYLAVGATASVERAQ